MNRSEQSLDASVHPAVQPFPARNALSAPADPSIRPSLASPVTISYAERKVIFEERQSARAIYQVVSGAVVMSRTSADGRRQVLEILGPEEIFGVVAGPRFDSRAETLTRTIVRRIDRSAAERSLSTQKLVTRQLAQKLAGFHDHTAPLGRKAAAERIASLLISLPRLEPHQAPAAGPACGADKRIALTQSDMANLLGLAIETVCRVLGDLKRRGVVSMPRRRRIDILDFAALSQLAGH